MSRKILTSVLCSLLVFLSTAMVKGQSRQDYLKEFLSTQWWLGVKIGTNLTTANPTQRFSGITPINFDANTLDKSYGSFDLAGVFAGLDITFYHKGISIAIQPNFRRSRFSYENDLFWESEEGTERFESRMDHEQKIDFFDFPVLVKYDFLKTKVRPYVMGGAYISFVTNAEKSVKISQRDFSSGTTQNIDAGELIIGVRDNFGKFDYGVMGGIGASYDFWNIRAVLEGSYRFGLTNLVNENNRFLESQLTGIGDVNDDFELKSINISLSLVFPLRFISKQFQAF